MRKFEIMDSVKKWLWRIVSFADKWLINNTALLIFLIVLSIGIIVGHILFWDWFAQLDEKGNLLAPNSEIIRNAALMFAGIWGFYGVVVAARRVAIQERGQIAERYARAAEQLDSRRKSVQMVAVLALQKIAREADEETLMNIVETLCAYTDEEMPESIKSNRSREFPAYLQRQIMSFLNEKEIRQRINSATRRKDS